MCRLVSTLLSGVLLCVLFLPPRTAAGQEQGGEQNAQDHSESRFSDEPIPLADLPERPRPLIELGEPFLGTGTLNQGFRIPTGAVWQPAFIAFGSLRSALQSVVADPGDGGDDLQLTEMAFRFDLFGNLYLTATERVLVGFRPLDQEGRFTRYTLDTNLPLGEEDFEDELNFGLRTLFFEGDIGELFPALDWNDSNGLDIGIAVGRQPLSFQDGMLINEDAIDAVGLTKANIKIRGLVNTRVTALVGWGDINRTGLSVATGVGNIGDKSATLVGLFTETDTRKTTYEIDFIAVLADEDQGSGLYGGIGGIRRFGRFNNTWRVVGSATLGELGLHNQQGVLIANQFSWTPHHTHNHIYINAFVGIEEYRSAARGPSNGGPLGSIGILFASVGLGRVGTPLGNHADNAFGGSVGYQMFFRHTRHQLILEVGGRSNYAEDGLFGNDTAAGGARYQLALGRRGVLILDAFGIYDVDLDAVSSVGRIELLVKL